MYLCYVSPTIIPPPSFLSLLRRHSRPPPSFPRKRESTPRSLTTALVGAELAVVAGVGGRGRFSLTQPSPAGRGPSPGGLNGGRISNRHPSPSFRRRPESRTPVKAGELPTLLSSGRGVDSRFRGNDGRGRRQWRQPCRRRYNHGKVKLPVRCWRRAHPPILNS